MNMKKILAAIAACAMSAAMLGMTVCAAGVGGDDETLDDETSVTDPGDITLDDGGDDETPDDGGDETPADDGADDGANDVANVPSPGTGNSPIALAVIPVALAAAAVVAKKAK